MNIDDYILIKHWNGTRKAKVVRKGRNDQIYISSFNQSRQQWGKERKLKDDEFIQFIKRSE